MSGRKSRQLFHKASRWRWRSSSIVTWRGGGRAVVCLVCGTMERNVSGGCDLELLSTTQNSRLLYGMKIIQDRADDEAHGRHVPR